jgi:hypothetical protein
MASLRLVDDNMAARAGFRYGNRNGIPSPRSFAGSTRVLARSSSSAIRPKARRAANAGIGKGVGLPTAAPRALVNYLFVTG